jgi:hypothetical protein
MKTIVQWVLISIIMCAGAGCTKTVLVPVSSCPAPPPVITMPVLMVDTLPPQATTQDKLHAIKMDYGTLRRELEACIVIVDGYKKAEPKLEPQN